MERSDRGTGNPVSATTGSSADEGIFPSSFCATLRVVRRRLPEESNAGPATSENRWPEAIRQRRMSIVGISETQVLDILQHAHQLDGLRAHGLQQLLRISEDAAS